MGVQLTPFAPMCGRPRTQSVINWSVVGRPPVTIDVYFITVIVHITSTARRLRIHLLLTVVYSVCRADCSPQLMN